MSALLLCIPTTGARDWPIEVLVDILQARLLRAEGVSHYMEGVLLLMVQVVLDGVGYA